MEELALALDLKDCSCQETAATLRQCADVLDGADRYDAHMAMGTLLAHRYAAAQLSIGCAALTTRYLVCPEHTYVADWTAALQRCLCVRFNDLPLHLHCFAAQEL